MTLLKLPGWLPRPTRGGKILILFTVTGGASGLQFENNLLFLLSCLAAGILAATFAMSHFNLTGINVKRRLPHPVFAGTSFESRIVIENSRSFFPGALIYVRDHTGKGCRLRSPLFAAVPFVPARESVEVKIQSAFFRRGVKKFVHVELFSTFPLGLFRARRKIQMKDAVAVYPRLIRIPGWLVPERLMKIETQAVPVAGAAGDYEFAGLREYRPGDNPKWIHYKSSARLDQKLLVREFEAITVKRASIILHAVIREDSAQERGRLEKVISTAASLARELVRERYQIEFILLGKEVKTLQIAQHDKSLFMLFYELAVLKPGRENEMLYCPSPARRNVPVLTLHPGNFGREKKNQKALAWK